MEDCKLKAMFDLRLSFMKAMQETIPGSYPVFPVDISEKASQQVCRDLALKGVEEMFEALGHLKNWKPHRKTDVPQVDREEFLEEIVDSFNYFFSLMILIGVDVDEFYGAFKKKDKIIRDRILDGY